VELESELAAVLAEDFFRITAEHRFEKQLDFRPSRAAAIAFSPPQRDDSEGVPKPCEQAS
jgi:hypothetical protein